MCSPNTACSATAIVASTKRAGVTECACRVRRRAAGYVARCTTRSAAWCDQHRQMRLELEASVVLLDCNVAVDGLDVLGRTRDGHGFVCCRVTAGVAAQPYDAILVRLDMNPIQAGQMLRGQFGLD